MLELGSGRGRNTQALDAAGLRVRSIADGDVQHFESEPALYDAALSTHGLLHGTAREIQGVLAKTAAALKPGALLFGTLGSVRDTRFGKGEQIGAQTFAPDSGDEAGVPHTYFDEAGVRSVLTGFDIESIEETGVDAIAGRWAHARRPEGSVHWFVRASKR